MQNFVKLLQEIENRQFKISSTTRGEQIQQTERNALKKELMTALKKDLAENYDFVYISDDGILVEVSNNSIADNLKSETGSGAITLAIDLKVMNLDTNAEVNAESYRQDQQEKQEKKEAKAKAKAKKIASDKKARAEKAKA